MPDDKVDVIIVGAGVAGCAAAYALAQKGLEVVLIERGPFPGSKNLSGGVLYGRVLHNLIPNYWETAPVERYVNNQVVTFMTGDSYLNLDFKTQQFSEPPYNGFTVLRSKFDRWFSEQAEAAGAMLVAGIKVDSVLKEDGRIVGIVAGDEPMRSDVVIAADGANSFMAQEAGLRGKVPPEHVAVGVKEVIGLPREVIEERFHLTGNEGAAYNVVGFASRGVPGGGFLYTNLDSLSVGLVIQLADLVKAKLKPGDLIEDFLAHPMIAPLVKGGTLLEYGAHLVTEAGLAMTPKLHTDGMVVVGDAAGFTVNNGFVIRGMDLAIGSALAAADAIVEAKEKGDFSASGLSAYPRILEKSNVWADMKTYARAPHFMSNERLFVQYPEMLANVLTQIYRQEALPKQHVVQSFRKSVREAKVSLVDLARDALNGARSL